MVGEGRKANGCDSGTKEEGRKRRGEALPKAQAKAKAEAEVKVKVKDEGGRVCVSKGKGKERGKA